jgi:hypothetical protein
MLLLLREPSLFTPSAMEPPTPLVPNGSKLS